MLQFEAGSASLIVSSIALWMAPNTFGGGVGETYYKCCFRPLRKRVAIKKRPKSATRSIDVELQRVSRKFQNGGVHMSVAYVFFDPIQTTRTKCRWNLFDAPPTTYPHSSFLRRKRISPRRISIKRRHKTHSSRCSLEDAVSICHVSCVNHTLIS